MNRTRTGENAETLAHRYLEKRGLQLVHRNFRCKGGEIDLVMRDGDSLVFVEVRYRRRTNFGRAAETVSQIKQARIIHCARYYVCQHQSWDAPARFDVVSIEGSTDAPRIEWFRDAFQSSS